MKIKQCIILLWLLSLCWGVQSAEVNNNEYDCFELAGQDANIDPLLLRAVAWQESGLNFKIIGSNALAGFGDGYGYGVMQIDSQHLHFLKKYGITKENLISDICLNIYVGAYFMAVAFNKYGNKWEAVGAYNAGFKENRKQHERRVRYARKVHATYQFLKKIK